MSSPTNVLYLGIRVEDRDANRAVENLNRNLDSVGERGRRGGDEASRAIEQLRRQLVQTAKVPPPPIPTEKLRQMTAEIERFKRESGGLFQGWGAGFAGISEHVGGLTKTLAGAYAGFLTLKGALGLAQETAAYAARTEQLGFALDAVAKSANLSVEAVNAQVSTVQKLGFTMQASRSSLTRLIGANIDFRKSTDLARLSQNLGRVAGIQSTEAYERLIHAIVTLQPEMLRTLGLTVSLERSYRQYAKQVGKSTDDLTELEKRQVAVNAVLDAGQSFAGAYEASMKTAGGQVLSMQRYFQELQEEIGQRFLPAYTKVVTLMADSLHILRDNVEVLDRWADGWKLTLLPLVETAGVLEKLIGFVKEYNAQAPRTLDPNSINDKNQIDRQTAYARAKQADLFKGATDGFSAIVNMWLAGGLEKVIDEGSRSVDETLRRKNQTARAQAAQEREAYQAQIDAARAESEAERKKFEERAQKATEQTRQMLQQAQLSELQGLARINQERQIALRDLGLTAEAVQNINRAFDIGVARERIRMAKNGRTPWRLEEPAGETAGRVPPDHAGFHAEAAGIRAGYPRLPDAQR